PPEIQINVTEEINDWLFSFKDNGIGFDPKYSAEIFVIFKRLHHPSDIPGTGIGLAICKRIIELHSGKIWAKSDLGKGATFFFTLPKTLSKEQTAKKETKDSKLSDEEFQTPKELPAQVVPPSTDSVNHSYLNGEVSQTPH